MMKNKRIPRRLSRREFLRFGSGSAMMALLAGSGLAKASSQANRAASVPASVPAAPAAASASTLPVASKLLVATDGFASFPGRRFDPAVYGEAGPANPVYVFGFRDVLPAHENADPDRLIRRYKGYVHYPSPILMVENNYQYYLNLTTLGFNQRPDLDDAHTIHWHGFRNPNAIFDGVPEVSVSVGPATNFPYYFVTHDPGTYLYHCHFEDVEHVQMGMDGIINIKSSTPGYTYDDSAGNPIPATAFDREFSLLLGDVDLTPHDKLLAVQEFVWSDFKPQYFTINGRSYPDTIIRDQDLSSDTDYWLGNATRGYSQPISSLIQVEQYDTALLRMSNVGYEEHTMQLLGIPMNVIGHDAVPLIDPITGIDNSYDTNSTYIGPGENRDILFEAPMYDSGLPGGTDPAGAYNVYYFANRSRQALVNGSLPGLGGMMTEVRVYATLAAQPSTPNATL